MFVYAIKKGINKGYIDSATYLPVATKGWAGVKTKITFGTGTPPSSVTIAGAVAGMGVQTSFANYVAIKATNNAPHGFAGVLAAASVME
jgi:rhamnogalacturonyl hydrolase YesR